jgi:hypothetical protein
MPVDGKVTDDGRNLPQKAIGIQGGYGQRADQDTIRSNTRP